jgi:RNA polymerase sigma factor (sigma-70 family)
MLSGHGEGMTSPAAGVPDSDERLRRLYTLHGRLVLAYTLRRTASAEDAADAVAETFLVAWRRLDSIPSDEALPWLYGVARRVLANQRRAAHRRVRLAERLRQELPAAIQAIDPPVASNGPVMAALRRLSADDQEILLLAAWEQLAPNEIAEVLGVSRIAARSRLHRARQRLADRTAEDAEHSSTTTLRIEEAR